MKEKVKYMAKKLETQIPEIKHNDSEKQKALEAAKLQIEKQFGKGSLMKLGEKPINGNIQVIPSGAITLDAALGIGGYPKGRIIEIFGPESSGKTTIALHAIAESQKQGGVAAFIDAEHALDPVYAKNLGVNTEDLWVSQPDAGEQALEIAESLVRSGAVDIIVIDSVAALTPQAEIEGDMGDSHMGLQARLMSQALRKLTSIISKSNTCLIFINQIRMKIGVMFGNPETTTGGNALKFYSSLRLEVRKVETIEKSAEEVIGNRVRVKVVKNKVAPPFRKVELEIIFGKGVSATASLLDAAVNCNIIQKSGSWYSHGEEKIGQGKENTKEFMEKNPQFLKEIEAKVREVLFQTTALNEVSKSAPQPEDTTQTGKEAIGKNKKSDDASQPGASSRPRVAAQDPASMPQSGDISQAEGATQIEKDNK